MTTSIAEYFLDELYDWKSTIELYVEEIDDSEEWLKTLLHFDSVPALAANVEHHLNRLFLSKENLLGIKSTILFSEGELYKDQAPVNNDLVSQELRKKHAQLRNEMRRVERNTWMQNMSAMSFLPMPSTSKTGQKKLIDLIILRGLIS